MTLQERLTEDMKQAMRSGDKVRLSVVRILRSEVHNEEIARQRELSDEDVMQVIARLVRQYRDGLDQFRQGRRQDLVDKTEAELAVLTGYLPPQLSHEEIAQLARQAIQEVGARGPTDKGKVMGRLMPQVRGKAEGSEVNAVVTEILEEGV